MTRQYPSIEESILTPKINFSNTRRQGYLDEESYTNTLVHIARANALNVEALDDNLTKRGRMTMLDLIADNKWKVLQLRYTAGDPLTDLANSLDEIVLAYEQYVNAVDDLPEEEYNPPFVMNDMIDIYVDYLNLVCVAILLRREDLIPRIHALNEGTDFDQVDAVLEELLKFFLPDRPELDDWLWNKPYRKLLDAIDSETPDEMAKEMKQYVKNWYKDMKGVAHFWSKHEQIKPDYTPYHGYWAMCAAAFTYLYNIDDSSYRDETVYPQDLIDYARSIPRNDDTNQSMTKPLRVAGGEPCPKSGHWFSPAKADSQGHFTAGTIMPDFPEAQYGLTIWQWLDSQ